MLAVSGHSQVTTPPSLKAIKDLLRPVEVPREGLPAQPQLACPLKFSEGLPPPRHVGAAVGAHTAEVLTELGYDAEQITALRKAGALS